MNNNIKLDELKEKNIALEEKVEKLEALVKFYEEQFRLLKHKQFGASSEKTQIDGQVSLFDELENTADKKTPEPKIEQIIYSRKKREGKREEDLSNLPVETLEYTLSEDQQVCPECGDSLHTMSKETRRELIVIPAQVKVLEHVQHIYSCRNCEKTNDHVPIIKASAPEPVIKGSLASPSAVSEIIVQKYVNAVPLFRQEQNFLRNGIFLKRQTMANWLMRCTEDWLLPVYNRLKSNLVEQSVLHADETVLQVLKELGKKATTNSYMWLYRTSGCAQNPIVLYEYQPTRSSSHPIAFLKDFNGYLHTDGYSAYHKLQGITVVGCWAHARRKFDEAVKALPEDQREGSAAQLGLDFCNKLFMFEREFAKLSEAERFEKRLQRSKPVAEEFFSWADSINALPKAAIGKAVHYALKQRRYLENIFLDGRLELSNNRAERSIKPFVIGRKNWLFCNSQRGAKSSSIIYSVIETAKENGLKPFEYLKFLFETLPNSTTSSLDSLLPWGSAIPAYCKIGKA